MVPLLAVTRFPAAHGAYTCLPRLKPCSSALSIGMNKILQKKQVRTQKPTRYIQQVAAIAKQHHCHGGYLFEVDRIGQSKITMGKGFH